MNHAAIEDKIAVADKGRCLAGERPANPVFFLRALGIMFADDA